LLEKARMRGIPFGALTSLLSPSEDVSQSGKRADVMLSPSRKLRIISAKHLAFSR
jgi:hypothetical protein